MKNVLNTTHVEGLVYQHTLELRTAGPNSANPGVQFINGNLDIATDDALVNIVTVHFTYVTETTKKGGTNATYTALMNIINGTICNVMDHGVERAGKVRIDSAIGLNEFYSDRNGEEELVSVKRNEGGFVHTITTLTPDENTRNTFKCDMLITGFRRIEADEERGLPEKGMLKGYIFDFRKALLPVEFAVTNPGGMDYFEGLEATEKNPIFTQVWGSQVATTIIRKNTTESAFGETLVEESSSSRREFVVTGTLKNSYEWDDESTMTAIELKEKMAERNVTIAAIKQRRDEWRASQGNNATPTANAPAAAAGTFNF